MIHFNAFLSFTGLPYINVAILYILALPIPTSTVDTININEDIINSIDLTDPDPTLAIIVIGDANGIYEQTFIKVLSPFDKPNILIINTTINIIITGPTLVPISSVFDTKAPNVANINE
ncbi:hypothetical protein SDC9_151059 [bioreactor metagenome]|uniref:Uncharacterized protein n=1 Tax=bioreactor metagenome TaxID=1076179 RepID=A0A645EP80_9ZZZZ